MNVDIIINCFQLVVWLGVKGLIDWSASLEQVWLGVKGLIDIVSKLGTGLAGSERVDRLVSKLGTGSGWDDSSVVCELCSSLSSNSSVECELCSSMSSDSSVVCELCSSLSNDSIVVCELCSSLSSDSSVVCELCSSLSSDSSVDCELVIYNYRGCAKSISHHKQYQGVEKPIYLDNVLGDIHKLVDETLSVHLGKDPSLVVIPTTQGQV
uniref:Uncharacterized protein n=1 Tax=Timema shepardi TaxID=629360 RepID=A0A7R9B414_TIMSH|nr:unnamed protein product [Timema shepardi]